MDILVHCRLFHQAPIFSSFFQVNIVSALGKFSFGHRLISGDKFIGGGGGGGVLRAY